MSARAKGNRLEKKVQDALREQGWLVERARGSHYGPVDFFGIADIMAVHPKEPLPLFVQVTTATNKSARKRKIEAVFKDLSAVCPLKRSFWLLAHHDRRGFDCEVWLYGTWDKRRPYWLPEGLYRCPHEAKERALVRRRKTLRKKARAAT